MTPDKIIRLAQMYGKTVPYEEAERVCMLMEQAKAREIEQMRRRRIVQKTKLLGLNFTVTCIDECAASCLFKGIVHELITLPEDGANKQTEVL